jgi:hypothetical protein
MLVKPLYEILPFGYITLGSVSFIALDPNYAIIAASIILYWVQKFTLCAHTTVGQTHKEDVNQVTFLS